MNQVVRKLITRKASQRTLIQDDVHGLILFDEATSTIKNLGYETSELLDFSENGKYAVVNSKKWLIKRNTNKSLLQIINVESNEILYSTDDYLAYRAIIDASSTKFLLEYYNGICVLDLRSGQLLFKKDKTAKNLYNADLLIESNKTLIPTEKKSLWIHEFSKDNIEEIKLPNIGATTWVRVYEQQNKVFIGDMKNVLHCYNSDSLAEPIWSLNFSKFGRNGRIWASNIFLTDSGLGCIHGFTVDLKENDEGILWIFNINEGKIVAQVDYSFLMKKLVAVIESDKILFHDYSSFSLTHRAMVENKYQHLINKDKQPLTTE